MISLELNSFRHTLYRTKPLYAAMHGQSGRSTSGLVIVLYNQVQTLATKFRNAHVNKVRAHVSLSSKHVQESKIRVTSVSFSTWLVSLIHYSRPQYDEAQVIRGYSFPLATSALLPLSGLRFPSSQVSFLSTHVCLRTGVSQLARSSPAPYNLTSPHR